MKNLFKCGGCNYMHEGVEAPDQCPKCGAPKEKFVLLSSEEAMKVYQSERTNDIHVEMIYLADKMVKLAREGININLDPGCLAAFEKAKNESYVIKQRAKAELEGHMKKGKW